MTSASSLLPQAEQAAVPAVVGAASATASAKVRNGGPGRLAEFLVVGGATLLLLPLAWLLRLTLGLDAAELVVGFLAFHAASLLNDPHFGVTYLLFYKNAKRRLFGEPWGSWQRVRYLLAGVLVPGVLMFWAAEAFVRDSQTSLGLMIQLMFLLVGWHYVKQGFGVLVVLSARHGVRFTALERRVVLAHCFAGWGYAWASPADFGTASVEKGVFYTTLAHPPGLEAVTLTLFTLSTLALGGVLGRKWLREGTLPFAPLGGFLITVWFWTVFSNFDPLLLYVIPALHSAQYLYFVWLLKRNEALEVVGPPLFQGTVRGRLALLGASAIALGWLLLRGVPEFLDRTFILQDASDPAGLAGLGPTPYFAAFFAFVNIHHYFMDTVIWRRDNPDTRHLRS